MSNDVQTPPTPNDVEWSGKRSEDSEAGQGFPTDTPLAEMTPEQQAAYWKAQSRKHEGRAKSRADYDELKAKAAALDKRLESEKSEHDRAVDQARKDGYEQARAEANAQAAHAMLRAALSARKVKASEIDDILAFTNTSALVADGDIDGDKILAFANRLAGKPESESGPNYPDMGQGTRGGTPHRSAREEARKISVARGYRKEE